MADFAKLIQVKQEGNAYSLKIDGQEFPWLIADGGIETRITRGHAPTVTVTILAERLELIHDLTTPRLEVAG
jgi:hypothetical protein